MTTIATDTLDAPVGACIQCGRAFRRERFVCLACHRPAEIVEPPVDFVFDVKGSGPEGFVADVKSRCCQADVAFGRTTCSPECHEAFVARFEDVVGAHKKVVDATTGIAHRVPTRDIIEKGLKWTDLGKYPRWEGE